MWFSNGRGDNSLLRRQGFDAGGNSWAVGLLGPGSGEQGANLGLLLLDLTVSSETKSCYPDVKTINGLTVKIARRMEVELTENVRKRKTQMP